MRGKYLAHVINAFPAYFTFMFVRNPFDRFVSYYMDGKRKKENRPRLPPHSMQEYAELTYELLENPDPPDRSMRVGPHQIEYRQLLYEPEHCRRQTDFLLDAHPKFYFGVRRLNDAPCGFVGRYEHLEKDLYSLLDILGGPNLPIKSRNVSIARRSEGNKRKHYSAYYDTRTRRLVEEIYARDLEIFGYQFEEADASSILVPPHSLQAAQARRRNERWLSLYGWTKQHALRLYFFIRWCARTSKLKIIKAIT